MIDLRKLGRAPVARTNDTPGVLAKGIYTGPIKPGEDIVSVAIDNALRDPATGATYWKNGQLRKPGKFREGDILAFTEAIVAYYQKNTCTYEQIGKDFEKKTEGAAEAVALIGLPSRNRGSYLNGILADPSLKKVTLVFTYPDDEVGNCFFADQDKLDEVMEGVNPQKDVFTLERFYEVFGTPAHKFTGVNYLEMYQKMCQDAGVECQILLANNFSRIADYTDCQHYLVARIHDRDRVANKLRKQGIKNVMTLADLMNTPVDGSGYNEKYGLLGCNHMDENSVKLFPRDCQRFVEDVQTRILREHGVRVEVMVYGDGAFKDPVGKIWELADPVVSPGFTSGLMGNSDGQVKAKKIIGENRDATPEELNRLIQDALKASKGSDDLTANNALGTTPRQISDLVGSLCDLVTGSGHRMTPVVFIRNYLDAPVKNEQDNHQKKNVSKTAAAATAIVAIAAVAGCAAYFLKKK